MHTLHTTQAFVLQRFPQGESNYTYKLLTRDLGLLYAHAQGVRELKSKNRFALNIGGISEITLVKGREIWRITGAQYCSKENAYNNHEYIKRILSVAGKFVPLELVSEEIFEMLRTCVNYVCKDNETQKLVEAVMLLRLMDKLGFVARPIHEHSIKVFLTDLTFSKKILTEAKKHKQTLIQRVNSALKEAS